MGEGSWRDPLDSASASCASGDAIYCESTGCGESQEAWECFTWEAGLEWGLRAVRICSGGVWVGPGLQKERESLCHQAWRLGPREGQGPV